MFGDVANASTAVFTTFSWDDDMDSFSGTRSSFTWLRVCSSRIFLVDDLLVGEVCCSSGTFLDDDLVDEDWDSSATFLEDLEVRFLVVFVETGGDVAGGISSAVFSTIISLFNDFSRFGTLDFSS